MAKMSELDLTVKSIRQAGEMLIAASDSLVSLLSGAEAKTPEPEPAPETPPETKPVTFKDVQTFLAKIRAGGKGEQVKGLLTKYGAAKLSDITAPDTLAALMKDAEVLT